MMIIMYQCVATEREREREKLLVGCSLWAWLGGAWWWGGGLCVAVSGMACSAAVSGMCAWPVVLPPSQTELAH